MVVTSQSLACNYRLGSLQASLGQLDPFSLSTECKKSSVQVSQKKRHIYFDNQYILKF